MKKQLALPNNNEIIQKLNDLKLTFIDVCENTADLQTSILIHCQIDIENILREYLTNNDELKKTLHVIACKYNMNSDTPVTQANSKSHVINEPVLPFLFDITSRSIKTVLSNSQSSNSQFLADLYKITSTAFSSNLINENEIIRIVDQLKEVTPNFKKPKTFNNYELISDLAKLSPERLTSIEFLQAFNDFKSKQISTPTPENQTETTREVCKTLCQSINSSDIRVDSDQDKLNLKINSEIKGKQLHQLHDALSRLQKAVENGKFFHQNGEVIVLKENSTQCHRICLKKDPSDNYHTIAFSDFISPRQHDSKNDDYYINMVEKDSLNQKEAHPSTETSTPGIPIMEPPDNTTPSELDIFLRDLSSPHLVRETIPTLVTDLIPTLNTLDNTDLLTYIYNTINQKARLCHYEEIRETFSDLVHVALYPGGPEAFFTAALIKMMEDDSSEPSQTASVSGSSIKETGGLDNVGNTCWLNAAIQNYRTMFQQNRLNSYLTTLNSKIQGNQVKQTLYDELHKLLNNESDSTESFVAALEAAVNPIRLRGIGHSATKLMELLSYAFNLDSSQNIDEEDAYFNEYGVSDYQVGIDDHATHFSPSTTKTDVLKIQLPSIAEPEGKINIGDVFSIVEDLTEGNEWTPEGSERSFKRKKRVLQHSPNSLCVNIDRKIYTSSGEKTIENPLSYYHHEGQDYLYFYQKVAGEDLIKKTWYKVESEAVHTCGFHWIAYNRNAEGSLVEYDDRSVNEVAEKRYHLTSQLMLSKTPPNLDATLNSAAFTNSQVSVGATTKPNTPTQFTPQQPTQKLTTENRAEQLISKINKAIEATPLHTSTRFETYQSLKEDTCSLILEINSNLAVLKKLTEKPIKQTTKAIRKKAEQNIETKEALVKKLIKSQEKLDSFIEKFESIFTFITKYNVFYQDFEGKKVDTVKNLTELVGLFDGLNHERYCHVLIENQEELKWVDVAGKCTSGDTANYKTKKDELQKIKTTLTPIISDLKSLKAYKRDLTPQGIRHLVTIAEKYSSLGEPYTTVLEELKTKIQILKKNQPKPPSKSETKHPAKATPPSKLPSKPKRPKKSNASSNTIFTPQNIIISVSVLSVVIGLICTNDDEENDLSSVLGNILPSFTLLYWQTILFLFSQNITPPDGENYVGTIKKGLPNGQGTYTWPNAKKYVGEFKNGLMDGKGIYTSPDGSKYVGEFKNNLKNGKGKVYHANGLLVYDGQFENGEFHGQGKLYHDKGTLAFEGQFENDKRNGQGKLYDAKGTLRYDGEWKNAKYHGKGKLYHDNGTLAYEGQFKNDKRNGQGKLFHDDGTLAYKGQFKNDVYNEEGKLFNPNGSINYKGNFKDGKMHGQGTHIWPNGVKYIGIFKNDIRNGQGKQYDAKGTLRYDGEWKNGESHGKGRIFFPDGSLQYDGDWENSKFHGKGRLFFPDGLLVYDGDWENSKYHGKGTLTGPDGQKYVGEFKNDKQQGQGKLYHADGKLKHEGLFDSA